MSGVISVNVRQAFEVNQTAVESQTAKEWLPTGA